MSLARARSFGYRAQGPFHGLLSRHFWQCFPLPEKGGCTKRTLSVVPPPLAQPSAPLGRLRVKVPARGRAATVRVIHISSDHHREAGRLEGVPDQPGDRQLVVDDQDLLHVARPSGPHGDRPSYPLAAGGAVAQLPSGRVLRAPFVAPAQVAKVSPPEGGRNGEAGRGAGRWRHGRSAVNTPRYTTVRGGALSGSGRAPGRSRRTPENGFPGR